MDVTDLVANYRFGSGSAVTGVYADKYAAVFLGGNVGIGTESPAYKIDISGTLRATGESTFTSNLLFPDSARIKLGNFQDYQIFHNGTNNYIEISTGHFYITNFADDKDIAFFSDDGSGGTTEYIRLDGGLGYTVVNKTINFTDSVPATFGNAQDLQIVHNGTNTEFNNYNGGVNFVQHQADGDIAFYADGGSGSAAEYFRLDGSNVNVSISKQFNWLDSVVASFGTHADLQIFHNGTHSIIADVGTGNLQIRAADFRVTNADNTEQMIEADTDGPVKLYHNNVLKFQTNSGGARFIGTLAGIDNEKVTLGTSNDLQIYHDGTNSHIESGGNLDLDVTGDIILDANGGDITFKDDGTNSCYTGKTYHFPTLQLDYDKDESAANQTQKEGIHNTMNSEDN